MQAVAQLCERAVLLDHGTVVQDGPSNDIVAQYLQSVGGGGSADMWHDLESAPGNDIVRMRSVRVVDEAGDVLSAVDVRRPLELRSPSAYCVRTAEHSFRRSSCTTRAAT